MVLSEGLRYYSAMAKINKIKLSQEIGADESMCKKILVFCMDHLLAKQIVQQLEKRDFLVCLVNDERKLFAQLDQADPELILIDISVLTSRPLDVIVAEIFAWMRTRARAINKFLHTPSQYLWQHCKVVLFKSDSEISATGSLTAEMADTDELVRLCSLLGDVKYIGLYSSFSFISKIRPFLENSYEG